MVLRQGAMQLGGRAVPRPGPRARARDARSASAVQNILFGVSARDPLTYGVGVGADHGGVDVATLVPARRATRVDPMIALRAE